MPKSISKIHFILYVADQELSTAFYAHVLGTPPSLNVPGMTEFALVDGTILGLMPGEGIVRLLGVPQPSPQRSTPRCEVYLVVDEAERFHARAIAAGAVELSPLCLRDWGHAVAYSQDADGNILAFATVHAGNG